ncbi:MAG: sugar ABC transporter permease [Ruminococcaceae bacterium]|nr:sugar ABC transporter permease [Oscillospiraceae bacterium]
MQKSLKIPKKRASLDARKARGGYFFVAPFIIGIILIYLPILLDSIWISFYKISYANSIDGVYVSEGLKYYIDAIRGDTGFVSSLISGLQQLVFEVPAVVIFSLFIAVVLNQKMLGRAVFRAIFFVPVIISTGFMETLLSDTSTADKMEEGINTGADQSTGSEIISVLDVQKLFGEMKVGTELVAYVVAIVNNVYQYINYSGVQMLIFLAGLQSISPSIYEASQIEGATGWETFWKITFPMISPMILVNAVYSAINAFTRTTNPTMVFIKGIAGESSRAAMYWIYFAVVMLIVAAVAAIMSTFIFYQRRD